MMFFRLIDYGRTIYIVYVLYYCYVARCYALTSTEVEGKRVATVNVKVDFVTILTIPFNDKNILFGYLLRTLAIIHLVYIILN